ncbi:MAG TPA: enoyl-CoA hydratase/isomerase family protein [Baekduia sp.]|nr:enoyl-CoA hydratase/isomerase family protein [Baekduia sp.]
MTESATVVREADGAVGRLTLNRPEAMNAITVELAEALEAGIRELAGTCEVIVIRGAGGNFCVGGDFHELERLRQDGPEALAGLFAAFGRACDAVGEVDVPVVTAVEGYAMAGGFELLQASDVAVVRADAKLADNHANFGQVPGGGGSQRLARLVGRQRASAHILTGGRLTGEEAVQWGLAYRCAGAEDFDAVLDEVVGRLTGKSRVAQARTKRLIRDGLELPLAEGLELERRTVLEHLSGEDAAAGIAAFRNRGES